jgi:opacity protein-like surface antigen
MKTAFPILAASLLSTAVIHAGSTPVADYTPAPEGPGWNFRVAPYAWLTAIDGDIGIGPLTAPVDVSFSDTLDTLDMAYMFLVEAGYDRWTLTADFVYGSFSKDIAGGGQPFRSFRYQFDQWVLTPTLGYRLVQTDNYSLDLFAGGRVTSFDTTLTGRFAGGGQIERSADDTWADPIIGFRGQAALGDKFIVRYNGDIGGFGVNSDLVWQAFLGLGYNFTENATLAIGYRGIGVDYTAGDYGTLDVINHGPLIGLEFRF